jgi:hypothetical protein
MAEITRKVLGETVHHCGACEQKCLSCKDLGFDGLAALCLEALDRLEDITTPTDDGDEFSRRHYLANLLLSRVGRRENG